MLLDHIKQSSDIKKLKEDQYPELAREIRQFLIEKISKTGGHLASNLGVVELTMALQRKALTMPSTQDTAPPPSLRVLDLPRREKSRRRIIR